MDRRIRTTMKDRKGNIVAVCNSGESWSPRRTKDVVRDISTGKKSYYVQEIGRRSYVSAVAGALRTSPDVAAGNDLDRLPTS